MARDVDNIVVESARRAAIDNAISEASSIMLAALRNNSQPFESLDEEQQEHILDEADSRFRQMFLDLMSAVGSSGFARIRGTVDKIAVGKLCTATLIIPEGEDLHLLTDLKGAKVTIVYSQVDAFFDKPEGQKNVDDKQMDLLDQAAAGLSAGSIERVDGEADDNGDFE